MQWLMSMLNGVDLVRQLSASFGESRMSWEMTSSDLPQYASSSLHFFTHALPSLHTFVHLPPHMAYKHPSPCTHTHTRHAVYLPAWITIIYTGNNCYINRKSLIGLIDVQADR